jgi:PDZ domain-containing protein
VANTEYTSVNEGPTVAYRSEYDPEPRRRSFAGGWISWVALALIVAGIGAVAVVPSDYVIEQPGPVFDTLGTLDVDGGTVPLIDIPSQQTYPTTGSLDMLTVSTLGNPDDRVTWLQVAQAWLDPSQALVPLSVAFPDGQTNKESTDLGAAQMQASQQAAVAAALTLAGYDFDTTVTVVAATPNGPADGLLLPGDLITAVNGTPTSDPQSLRALIAENGTEKPLTITAKRDGAAVDVPLTPMAGDDGKPIVGIEITEGFVFPFEVTVQLSDVGGPSAGQMFALAIFDKLTPGSLNGGLAVAGTGTISPDGEIGPIGGITQKLYGAERAGARFFLAPSANCKDIAAGSVPEDMQIFAVDTLGDSLYVLNSLSAGAGTSLLPRCPAS